mmetsp:Transcript_6217/g.17184  ORF Transcript_6217/g.17184 Transcript_6217/m.17184 type:complete len:287 (-) Transcript_6217:30-890(-)
MRTMPAAPPSSLKRPCRMSKQKKVSACSRLRRLTKDRPEGIRDGLTFGRRHRPSKIVVLLHGLNDSAKDCSKGVVGPWVKGLPGALIVVPESPDKTQWSSSEDPGYDWVPTRRPPPWDVFQTHGATSIEYQASLREYRRTLRARCRDLSCWLDGLLAKHGLADSDLVLVGFSLGAYLAAMVGTRRNVEGVIVCGGICSTRELRFHDLVPKYTRARFCAVNGTRDTIVHRSSLEAILNRYDCEWHWSRGVGHDFPDEWYATQLVWMQRLFGIGAGRKRRRLEDAVRG